MVFADKSLKIEEHIYRQLLMQQMEIKVGFNDYQTQVGKLKGLHFVSNLSNNKKEAFIKEVKQRISVLFSRIENIDVRLVEAIHS